LCRKVNDNYYELWAITALRIYLQFSWFPYNSPLILYQNKYHMNTTLTNESLGIQERTNKEYHDSLLKISCQIKDIFTELYTNKR
jgi:hypothetical protein